MPKSLPLLMDRACEDCQARNLARRLGMEPGRATQRNQWAPQAYHRALYSKRQQIQRLFRRLKAYRRVFTRFDKLDRMYLPFVYLPLLSRRCGSTNSIGY